MSEQRLQKYIRLAVLPICEEGKKKRSPDMFNITRYCTQHGKNNTDIGQIWNSQKHWFGTGRMILNQNMIPHLCPVKFCASLHSHLRIDTGDIVRKRWNQGQIVLFCRVNWPRNWTDDLEKQQRKSSVPLEALCILSVTAIYESTLELSSWNVKIWTTLVLIFVTSDDL